MTKLEKYKDYSREEVQKIFDPDYVFVPQAGRWGISGIVRIPERDGDFVFFVTFGQEQGDHEFKEFVTKSGVLYWQSQPRQSLDTKQIREFINHDDLINTIYLFLRTSEDVDYTYLGMLKYLTHDSEKERPVYFQWQITDWDIPKEVLERMELDLVEGIEEHGIEKQDEHGILIESVPPKQIERKGKKSSSFRSRQTPDYSERDRKNREIGLLGEKLVIILEKSRLVEAGRKDLADKVVHVSHVEGDGAGYDVKSFTPEGRPKYIEVKTTAGGKDTAFFVSANELETSRKLAKDFYIYRIYDLNRNDEVGKYYEQRGSIDSKFELMPTNYRVRPK